MRRIRRTAVCVAVGVMAAAVVVATPLHGQQVTCEKCHGDRLFLLGKATTAEADAKLFVPGAVLTGTAHTTLGCAGCHPGPAAGYPHSAGPLVEPCATCHATEGRDWAASSHAGNVAAQGDGATCVDCHGNHEIHGADDRRSTVHPLNLAATCGACHADERIIGTYFSTADKAVARTAVAKYFQTVHGAALTRSGLVVSATCNDCHGAHRILPADSAGSTISHASIPATCGSCHTGVRELYAASAHGRAGAAGHVQADGDPAPVCIDCHSGHEIVRADEPSWFLGAVEECGACHEELYETYFETYHGKVTRLGFLAATCSDCHTAHDMRSPTDPASSVFPTKRVETCGRCHEGANTNFTKYYSHGDPTQRTRYPLLFWPYMAMTTLLVSVMSFFGLHTVLWLARSALDRRRAAGPGVAATGE